MDSPRPRKLISLSDSINRKLSMYALAAGAAGVGMLASTMQVEAKVIYTKSDIPIPLFGYTLLDLNNDGVPDFYFYNIATSQVSGRYVSVLRYQSGNAIRRSRSNDKVFAAALRNGVRVGPKDRFSFSVLRLAFKSQYGSSGPWIGVKQRDLGLRFGINGKMHYAWARIKWAGPGQTEYIVGYAYETTPNRPIITGKTKGPDVVTVQPDIAPGSLGRLALGRK